MKMAEVPPQEEKNRRCGGYWAAWTTGQKEAKRMSAPPQDIRADKGLLYCVKGGRWCAWINLSDGSCTKEDRCQDEETEESQ